MIDDPRFDGLPGWEIVSAGLVDIAARRTSVASLLVQSASMRMRELGLVLQAHAVEDGNAALYMLVAAEVGEGRAHSRYNALRRRLAKFLRAAGANAVDGDAALH